MPNLISVVPAAGLGTRLGVKTPKLFVEIKPNLRVIEVLERNICGLVDECCFVIRPDMVDAFKDLTTNPKSSYVIQEEPIGMGDAVFRASEKITSFTDMLVIWGDQVSLSSETLEKVITSHRESDSFCTIPLVKLEKPYVHYEVDEFNNFIELLQEREGDSLPSIGYSDIGVFMLRTDEIQKDWLTYLEIPARFGGKTHEINFLPFLHFLAKSGRKMNFLYVDDPFESLGMNTSSQLEILRNALKERGR